MVKFGNSSLLCFSVRYCFMTGSMQWGILLSKILYQPQQQPQPPSDFSSLVSLLQQALFSVGLSVQQVLFSAFFSVLQQLVFSTFTSSVLEQQHPHVFSLFSIGVPPSIFL